MSCAADVTYNDIDLKLLNVGLGKVVAVWICKIEIENAKTALELGREVRRASEPSMSRRTSTLLLLCALAAANALRPLPLRNIYSSPSHTIYSAQPRLPLKSSIHRVTPAKLNAKDAAATENAVAPSDIDSCPTKEVSTLELFKFIVPTLAGWISSEMMTVIDTAIVGTCSASELAALGPASMLTDSGAYLFFWLNVATTSLFASALASGKPQEAYDVLSDALWVALGCGIVMTALMATFGGNALLAICSNALSIVPAASKYLYIRLLGLPAFMTGMVLQAACLGAKDSVSPLIVLVSSGLLNLGEQAMQLAHRSEQQQHSSLLPPSADLFLSLCST